MQTVYGLWIGGCLSAVEQLVVQSYLQLGHHFVLYTYEGVQQVPAGAEIRDANKILDKKHIFVNNKGSLALFSDWFRWEMLYRHGGYWVDMDMVCLQVLPQQPDIIFGWESELVGSGLLCFPAGHPFCRFMADSCAEPNRWLPYDNLRLKLKKLVRRYLQGNHRGNVGWGEIGGPKGLSRAVEFFGLQPYVQPETMFYPVHFDSWQQIYQGGIQLADLTGSYTVHLYNEMLRQHGYDKNQQYPQHSLLEQLKSRFGLSLYQQPAADINQDKPLL
ncbi:glycosyltransferase [Rheinheimera sp.]|uniref:glycosyltransferase n=1 Tax=Rheinheimera sp. TaxID=1869214 RepID=UPI0027B92397|nr:glycosyltransferase [Rheinheimera sp.]